MRATRYAGVVLAAVTCFAAGCSDGPKQEAPEGVVQEGLSLLETPTSTRLSAIFRKGDRSIYLESVRGPRVGEPYASSPGFPEYEMDARFIDQEGRTFIWQRGGDRFIDPTWQEEVDGSDTFADPDDRQVDFELAQEASSALLKIDLPEDARVHPSALAQIHSRVHLGLLRSDVSAREEFELGLLPRADENYGSGYYRIEIWKMSIVFGMGEHSATLLWKHNASAGTVDAVGFSCNHGQCGGNYTCNFAEDGHVIDCPMGVLKSGGEMSLKCSSLFYATDGTYQPDHYAGTEHTEFHTGACLTPYDWNSGDGKHNCHDDSRVQYRNVADPGFRTTGYDSWCNESGSLWNAPDCVDYGAAGLTTVCGDGTCGANEDCASCPNDCGACPVCGDGTCNPGESSTSCPADCTSSCPSMAYSTTATNSASYSDADTRKFTVRLNAGTQYTISTCGTSTTDTYLRLFLNGTEKASNDDSCNQQSSFTYTPTTTADFVVAAGCYSTSSCSGTVVVSPAPSCGPVCGNGTVETGEQCDGGACCNTNCTFKSAGTSCRAAANECDAAEACTGTSSTCPADVLQPDGTTCSIGSCQAGTCVAPAVCGNGTIESGEQCDGGACCTSSCTFVSSGTVCRAASSECDVAESCSGSSSACPADALAPDGTTCSIGTCAAGVCTTGPSCGDGSCNGTETCSTCAADCGACGCTPIAYSADDTNSASYTDPQTQKFTIRLSAGTAYTISTCNASTTDTYLRLHLNGTQVAYNDDSCGSQSKITYTPSTTADFVLSAGCYSDNGCSGTITISPLPVCGPACGNSVVESGEQCDGGACCNTNCTLKASGTVCRASASECDAAEACDGQLASCPADAMMPDGSSCTGGSCTDGVCVAPAVCGNGVVETGEQCDGGACCASDCQFTSASTVCRAAAGECDVAEVCSGAASTCPSDAFAVNGTTCSSGTCQSGVCQSSSSGWNTGLYEVGISLALDDQAYYSLVVPTGATNVEISTTGGTGDVDLLTRKDAPVSESTYDCAPWEWGNEETCTHSGPGTYNILLDAYEACTGVTLIGRYYMP